MTVTARFKVTKIEGDTGYRAVTMAPVYSSDPTSPNYSFSQATPSGEIRLTVSNPAAWPMFDPVGKSLDITFNPTPQE